MGERPTTRRQFLHGRSAAEALAGAREQLAFGDPGQASQSATLTVSRRAMACEFQIRLHASAGQNETAAALAALDTIEAVEDRLTVYREHSELIELNQLAAAGPAEVEPDVFSLLELADRLHHETAGAYDITSGPLSDAWGFSRREGRMPTSGEIAAVLSQVGWQNVSLDAADQTVAFASESTRINFNSMGKGFALDQAAGVLKQHGVTDSMLHGGRSTLVAIGSAHSSDAATEGDADSQGWSVGIRHPLRPQQRIAECRLVDAAFSTSGSATQCFVHGGKRYGHLIDPRTGWPAEGLHSVSVVASTGAEADALSTAFYVMGYEQSAEYCRRRPDVQALFVLPTSAGDRVEVRHENLDESRWRLEKSAASGS